MLRLSMVESKREAEDSVSPNTPFTRQDRSSNTTILVWYGVTLDRSSFDCAQTTDPSAMKSRKWALMNSPFPILGGPSRTRPQGITSSVESPHQFLIRLILLTQLIRTW